jgi:PAS domain S-box-containing protein
MLLPPPKISLKNFFSIFLTISILFLMLSEQSFAKQIKVGVYSNKPLVFQDEQGEYQGLTIDVLRTIAAAEGWDLNFVPGSWSECLQRLKNGEIDLQVAIAFSAARSNIFSFPKETLITNWGRLYRNPDITAGSLLDLDGKTIALLEKDIHAKVFAELMDKFSKNVNSVYLQSYDEVLEQVEAGKVDLGVVNRMYAMQNAHRFNVKATPMIFNPIEVRYAAPKGKDSAVLEAIDRHLALLREDKHSIYYKSLEKWFGQNQATTLPQWIKPTLLAGGGLLFFIFLISLILKKQVSMKTKDLRTVFDSSPTAIFIHDMDGTIIELNQTMLEMFKVNKKEALSLSMADDYSSPQNPLNMLSAFWRKASDGNPQQFEWIARRPNDDSTFLVQVNLNKIIYGNRKVIYATMQDITAKKETEDNLASEQERLAVTLRSIGDGVIATDTVGSIVFLNKVAEDLTGWTNEEAQGKPSSEIFNIINEKTGQKCVSPIQRVLQLGRIVGLANHTALIAKDGTSRSIADSGAPIRDKESKVVGVVLVFRDVSHEHKMEEELLKIRKLESIGVLAGGIAHDFNNILAAILGNIELTTYRITKEDTKSLTLLNDAKKATKRATKLTQQLLTFAKGGDPVREEIILPELITESTDFVLHGSRVACNYSFPDNLWRVDVDSGQIGQVIQNIIINAKHAMPAGGTISIRCDNISDAATESLLSVDQGNYVRITLQDTGIGIPREIIDKIFDPYFSTKQEGSGLGLAICHSIINKHEGYLTVDSIPGKGTNFTIYLPAILHTKVTSTDTQGVTSPVKAAKVMIMDDEAMLLDVAQSQLAVLGHEAILVTDGVQAINRYQELQDNNAPVDLVIMDLTIPGGMGGQEAAQKLLQVDPKATIIVASGYSNDPVMADYKEYGFRAAIAKPFDLKELSNTIASVL